jgi:hypothetical protein
MYTKDLQPSFLAVMVIGFLMLAMGCQTETPQADEADGGSTMAQSEANEAWQALFDGTNTDQWRKYRGEAVPPAWVIAADGTLFFSGEGEGGDIVTRDQYENFELELEWKISEGGNSGIMFRVSEDHDYPWRTGPEVQILDDERHPDTKEGPDRWAGANYDMHPPSSAAVHPAGEWNQVRLVVDGAHVEHWLNGVKVVDYELWSDTWKELIAQSKWNEMPDYGMRRVGASGRR